MSDKIKKYAILSGEMEEYSAGDWVQEEDYKALKAEVREIKAILTYLISECNNGNLQMIDYQQKTGEGTYYDIEIVNGKIKLLNSK